MIEPQPTSNLPSDANIWQERQRLYDQRAAEALSLNKEALFTVLAAAGIGIVAVSFDGYGDSGQIESIEAKIGNEPSELPATNIEIVEPEWNYPEPGRRTCPLSDAIETIAYQLLSHAHGGWENDDGAFGDFTFDVAERSITLDYNERVTASDYSQHVF